jgi:tetratricopeptide (TPR) repeat protein
MKIKSDIKIDKKIRELMSSKNFNKSFDYIEANKDKLSEIDYWFYLSVNHRYLEKYQEALSLLTNVLKIDSAYGRAYQEYGHNYIKLDNADMALKSYVAAVKYNPSLQASWLGILTLDNADEDLKTLANTKIIYLKNLPPELKSVLSFIHEGKLKKADNLCRFYLQNSPHHIDGMKLLATICTKLHVYDDAEFLLESCLEFEPNNLNSLIQYVDILIKRQKYGSALENAKKMYKQYPDAIDAQLTYAVTLQQTDNQDEALELYKKLLDKHPASYHVYLSIGHLYKNFGSIDKSIKSYKQSYKINNQCGEAYWSLANLKTYKFDDKEIRNLEDMVLNEYINNEEKIPMHFALGKAFEDEGDYKKSFNHYELGNNLKIPFTKFTSNDFKNECLNQMDVCTSDLFETKKDWGHLSDEPIFILGLPRVGSTLIEQILASHSKVDATHELPNILATSHKLNLRKAQNKESRYPDILLSLSAPQLKMIGENYIKDSEVFRKDGIYFIDKMPNNFRHIGLIKLILPNAKIIDIRRNSMSACFSCYKQLFAEGQEFTYSLERLGNYYNNYVDLMNHWNKVLPNQILSVNYEDLINNFEDTVKIILDYCKLPFEDACIEFYKSKRSVKTPSAQQVRQPIYTSGLDYWKNYDPYLDELKKHLRY